MSTPTRCRPNGCTEPAATGPGWTVCLTDDQLETELEHVVALDHLPTTNRDMYFIITPDGFGSCTDASSSSCALGGSANGYCGYHSETPNGILYAVIPYNAVCGHCQSGNPRPNSSTADPTISTISHEHNETVTDPDGNAWIDAAGQRGRRPVPDQLRPARSADRADGVERVDPRRPLLPPGGVEQRRRGAASRGPSRTRCRSAWSQPAGQPRVLSFTAHGSDPQGQLVSFDWFFGDGRAALGRRVSHTFNAPGELPGEAPRHRQLGQLGDAPRRTIRVEGGARPGTRTWSGVRRGPAATNRGCAISR